MSALSVGVPTYRRFALLNAELLRWSKANLDNYLNVVVVNDSGVEKILSDEVMDSFNGKVKIINHGENRGYAQAFYSILKNCQTEYCLVIADDDLLNIDNAIKLTQIIDSLSSDILVLEWSSSEGQDIKKLPKGKVRFSEIRHAMNHAPGILYKRSTVLPILESLLEGAKQFNDAAFFFPQVLLAYKTYLVGEIEFSPLVIGGYRKEGPVMSDLKDSEGRSYGVLDVQFKIRKTMIDYLINITDTSNGIVYKNEISAEAGRMTVESLLLFKESVRLKNNSWRSLLWGNTLLLVRHPLLTTRAVLLFVTEKVLEKRKK